MFAETVFYLLLVVFADAVFSCCLDLKVADACSYIRRKCGVVYIRFLNLSEALTYLFDYFTDLHFLTHIH